MIPYITPIKIVIVIDDLGRGGAQRQLVEILKSIGLQDRYRFYVISLSAEKNDYEWSLRDAGFSVSIIPQSGKFSFKTLWELVKLFRAISPDVVHTWLFTADFYGRVAALIAGVPHLISAMRNTVDDMPFHYRWVSRVLGSFTRFVTINANAIRPGVERALGIPPARIKTIMNGIDLAAFPILTKKPGFFKDIAIPPDALVVAMAARMAIQKDYFTYLKAAKRVLERAENTYFLLIGDGPLRPQIEKEAEALGIMNRVRFLGKRSDVWELLNQIDLFVLSTHFEGCSNVIMEAMAAEKPVIATLAGGNAELVTDSVTGYLIPIGDDAAMAEKILTLINNPDLAIQMAKAGRNKIASEFTIARTAKETLTLYETVCKRAEKIQYAQ